MSEMISKTFFRIPVLGKKVAIAAIAAALCVWTVLALAAAASEPTRATLGPPELTSASTAQPPPAIVRDIAPEEALKINAQLKVDASPGAAAEPFSLGASSLDRDRAAECLAEAIYYEAGSESLDGERAVAQVVLNRVRHVAFPSTVCGVVYQGSRDATGCQFTFTCDGSLNRPRVGPAWKRARQIAQAALAGSTFAPVGLSTHYHANYVLPYWAATLKKSAAIGAHSFYRWPGFWGQASAFRQNYSGGEPNPDVLRHTALVAVLARARSGLSGGQAMALQLANTQVDLMLARMTLGANNPKRLELEGEAAALSFKKRVSVSAQLAAVEAELKFASRTLGARHPRMLALQSKRAELAAKPY